MYQLKYDENTEIIIQIDPTGKETIIAKGYSSKPEYSPDMKKALYISPLAWEQPGSLYLYNLENGEITELVSLVDNKNTPKYAIWINNEIIAVIIGFLWGTVAIGGNVYTYNINNHVLKQITHYPSEIQITLLNIKNESLELNGIKYLDETVNQFKEFQEIIPLNEIL
ncbi:DUF4652 domain-containing protein [Bacillus litorisediminis]|uniref:DUF4652 domain-containing protein n=1 Tax=Bacillus litorisediminis TaxID=2922713 RepID=UPI001FAFD89B|nr:DUF4652 domain-containing protein [Bacillus litorisediminis]